ncbi:hypothetical protein BG000_008189 [Podila horticola]|nr:hypothetical protein BG000_008189 [Podila horticola]
MANAVCVCGKTFMPKCGLDAGARYKCSSPGTTPELVEVCKDKNCIVNPRDNNCATGEECKCPDTDEVCGHAFPQGCTLDAKALYSCSGKGADPQKKQDCPVETFPAECKFDSEILYTCTAAGVAHCWSQVRQRVHLYSTGDDKLVLLEKCPPGLVCLTHADGPPDCGGTNCTCFGNKTVFSSQFTDACGFEKNAIYRCTNSGTAIKENTCEANKECAFNLSGATCGDCKCPDDGTI